VSGCSAPVEPVESAFWASVSWASASGALACWVSASWGSASSALTCWISASAVWGWASWVWAFTMRRPSSQVALSPAPSRAGERPDVARAAVSAVAARGRLPSSLSCAGAAVPVCFLPSRWLSTIEHQPLSADRTGHHDGHMTSTSTPSDPLASILSRQGHTPLRSESDRSPQVGPARGRSRFPLAPVPAGSADGMHRALWAGPDAALRELVADHATAAGLELVDEADPGPVAVQLMDAAALVTAPGTAGFRSRGASVAAGAPPLLVVTSEQVVTTSAWRSALASGARALLQL